MLYAHAALEKRHALVWRGASFSAFSVVSDMIFVDVTGLRWMQERRRWANDVGDEC